MTKREIRAIKDLASEKRIDYNLAPIGEQIFRYLSEKENNLFFEKEEFARETLDCLVYLSQTAAFTFFIINIKKPLINQIFATAFCYYYFIIKGNFEQNNPSLVSLANLRSKSQQEALRFSGEFLLPEHALHKEIASWLVTIKRESISEAKREQLAELCYKLTVKYAIPLTALLVRFQEEKYLLDGLQYLDDELFMLNFLQESEFRYTKKAKELVEKGNEHLDEIMDRVISEVYQKGRVSAGQVENDLKILGLNQNTGQFKLLFTSPAEKP